MTVMMMMMMMTMIIMMMTRYLLGRIISALLSEVNIHYWTSGGSTLGIVRFAVIDSSCC